MGDIGALTFVEIRDRFLTGKYEYNSPDAVEFGSALHDKLIDIKDILPLLKSSNHSCQFLGVYIAATEGDRACPVFRQVFNLIDSPWVSVRDEVCSCIEICGTTIEEFVKLFSMLNDPEEQIRVKIISWLMWINPEKAEIIRSRITNYSVNEIFEKAIVTRLDRSYQNASYEELASHMSSVESLEQVFTYLSCYWKYDNSNEFYELAAKSSVSDVKRHFEIYFTDE